MNKQKVIIISVIGLLLIGAICLVVATASKKKAAVQEIDVMTEVPKEYSYQDMMAAEKDDNMFNLDDTARAATVPLAVDEQTPAGRMEVQEQVAATPETAPEAAAALKDIRRRLQNDLPAPTDRTTRRAGPPTNQATDAEEDAKIRELISKLQASPAAPPPAAEHITAAPAPAIPETRPAANIPTARKAASTVTLKAVVLNDVEVANGSTVSIMLLEGGKVNGVQLGRSVVMPGIVNIQSNRVQITVTGGNINGRLADIPFTVYDTDGLAGLRIQGERRAAAAEQTAQDEVSRGVDAAIGGSGVLSGVVRIIKTFGASSSGNVAVKIPAGHKVLLKSEQR